MYKLLGQPYSTADPDSKWVYYRAAADSIPGGYKAYRPAEGKDAVNLLQSMGYRVRVNGYGKVTSQLPAAGTAAKKRSMVTLNMK